ncbi:hypothetical protein CASFOL_033256 [Castilleja foliolosa]|uniref:X8 domain-containing protein n=1 Tax=Castilleja foliolosa TaxID=1961234 RepID=A0ABD3BZN9_9LAMI
MGAGILIGPLPLLLFSLISASQGNQLWCVAKNNAEDAQLQTALDWACGLGRVDCGPIQKGGLCYDGSDLQRTASYAFNDYYLRNGPSDDNCNFADTAALTSIDPSHDKCKFVSSNLNYGNGNYSGAATAGADGSDLSSTSWVAIHWDLGLIAISATLLIL